MVKITWERALELIRTAGCVMIPGISGGFEVCGRKSTSLGAMGTFEEGCALNSELKRFHILKSENQEVRVSGEGLRFDMAFGVGFRTVVPVYSRDLEKELSDWQES